MTVLEKFMALAEALPPEQRSEVEKILASIMEDGSPEAELTAAELGKIKRRLADSTPEYVDAAEIDAMLAHDDHD